MIITRVIEIGIDVQDCIGIYADINGNVMNILNDKFKGICIRNCYIIDIIRIVNISECVINQNGLPDKGEINVIFEARVLVYNRGEIITGCKVVSNEDDIICATEYADIMLPKHALMGSIQREQLISVYVSRVKYTIGASRISIGAQPIFPIRTTIALKINAALEPSAELNDMMKLYTDAIAELEITAAKLHTDNPSAYGFFTQLLYSYQETQKPPQGARQASIKDIIGSASSDFVGKYVARDQRINMATDAIYVYDSDASLPDDYITEDSISPHDILLSLYHSYYVYLRALIDHIKTYNTQELIDSHRNLWIIFKSAKLK